MEPYYEQTLAAVPAQKLTAMMDNAFAAKRAYPAAYGSTLAAIPSPVRNWRGLSYDWNNRLESGYVFSHVLADKYRVGTLARMAQSVSGTKTRGA